MTTISVHHAKEHPQALIVDVRTPVEYAEVHIAETLLAPLDELQPSAIAERAAGRPIHVLCRSGRRAQQAAAKIDLLGY
ncbi:MAG: rhodanese-like domain-containing protein [Kiritimatiellaeota bacterium]|nr:rhodanese-like domain-containing protein [Kiritimatiellota bacterium]